MYQFNTSQKLFNDVINILCIKMLVAFDIKQTKENKLNVTYL